MKEVPEKVKRKVEELTPGLALVIECKSKEQAKALHRALSKWIEKEQLENILPHSYTCVLQHRLAPLRYLVTVRCYERPVMRTLRQKEEGGWEITEEEVL